MIDTLAETLGSATPGPALRPTLPQPPARPRIVRLRALDGLRLVAALMVAAYHYGGRGGEVAKAWGSSPRLQFPTLHTWFAYGCLGVQIFFVISGFVICMSGWVPPVSRHHPSKDGAARRSSSPLRSFFASRAARLLPAYWVAIVLVTAVMALPVLTYRTVSASETLVNLTLLQMPLGAHRVLGVCWTLWAEVRFYALFALCVVLPGATRRRVIMFCACWTLAAAIAGGLHQPVLDAVVMPDYAPFFIGGMGLYLVHRDRRDPYAWGITAVSWLIGQQVAVRGLWHPVTRDMFSYRSAYVIIAIVTVGFLAVAAIALGLLNRANWRWLTVAGALTYPFYLVHEHLGWPVIQALHRGLGIPSYGTLPLTVAITLTLAWLMNKLVEERFTPKLRALLNRPAGSAG